MKMPAMPTSGVPKKTLITLLVWLQKQKNLNKFAVSECDKRFWSSNWRMLHTKYAHGIEPRSLTIGRDIEKS